MQQRGRMAGPPGCHVRRRAPGVRRRVIELGRVELAGVAAGNEDPADLEGTISAASLAELHFGVLVARDADERARRAQRLGVIEATFDPLPIDAAVAREWGRLAATVAERGGRPRRRAVDLAIAATANVAAVPLLTYNADDFKLIADLVPVETP
jgi:predicted nucleic acid-binding protein